MGPARASSVACQSLSGVTSRGVTGRIFVATVSSGLAPKNPPVHSAPRCAGSHEADSSGKVQSIISMAPNRAILTAKTIRLSSLAAARPETIGSQSEAFHAQWLHDTDRGFGASFDSEAGATCGGRTRFREPGAREPHRSARSGVRGVTLGAGCGVAACHRSVPGTDEAGEGCCRGLGHRQVARRRLRCWPRQDDQCAQSKLVGKPLAALDQGLAVMSLLRQIGRLSRRRSAQGWGGHPSRSRRLLSLGSFAGAGWRPFRRRHALGESDCSLHIAHSFEKSRCPWLLSPSNKALATAPFPSGMVGRFPEAPISRRHERPGLPTANNHIERPLGRAR